jgi:hypothetical protein
MPSGHRGWSGYARIENDSSTPPARRSGVGFRSTAFDAGHGPTVQLSWTAPARGGARAEPPDAGGARIGGRYAPIAAGRKRKRQKFNRGDGLFCACLKFERQEGRKEGDGADAIVRNSDSAA